ncbi:MAG: hypothetical protein ACTSVU_02410 [Promethearchaeota archaeon]
MVSTKIDEIRNYLIKIWKIIDQPKVEREYLQNLIAFELYLFTLDKAKKFIEQAIKLNLLVEDEDTETVQLNPELNQAFLEWQKAGSKKVEEMKKILNTSWRKISKPGINQKYQAFEQELVDVIVKKNAIALRSSSIVINSLNLSSIIDGTAKDINGNQDNIEYPFKIDVENRRVQHNCPEFQNLRKEQKKFCKHLAYLMMKLYAKKENQEQIINLMRDIVINRNLWVFK